MLNTTTIIIIIVLLVLFLGFNLVRQVFRVRNSPLGRLIGIYNNLKYNEKLSRNYMAGGKPAYFKTQAWDKNGAQAKILPADLRTAMDDVFRTASEINRKLDAIGLLDGSVVPKEALSIHKKLAENKRYLEKWILANQSNPEYFPKRRGFFF